MAAYGCADARLGSRLAGFRLEAVVGRGGMGTVYRAEEVRLGRKVAVKLIAPDLAGDERFRERFLRESRVAASLDHPHVVPLLGAGEADGTLYLAMRYVDGADLGELIAEEGRLDPGRAVALLEQVAEALDAAHERGLVHRDVKPGNVLVARAGGREHAYLSDFGLAREASSLSGPSAAGPILGTLDYLAPEQIQGQRMDGRTDVYALACVLHEALTGTPPFPRATDVAALWAHVHEQPPRVSSIRPELGGTVDAAVSRGLAKQPEDRQASCGELLAEVRAALQPASPTLPAEDAVASSERKVVTVLVAGLAGFTERGEALDVEDVAATLAPHRERLSVDLARFGGTVEESVGDAVVAVFGAPVAHEDDPERAVRAAFAVAEWVREDETIQVRIGIDTGEALVTLRAGVGEPTIAGEVINAAARLQGAAPPDGILVGERTYWATREWIDYRDARPVEAKGRAEPARVWAAVEARSRFGVDTVHASAAPLAGRRRELTLLVDALARARAERAPQLVTLIGVPGIGKSRLVYELMRAAGGESAPILWRQGRCLPYGDGVTFWALGEIVKSQAGIFETDEAGSAEQKLAAMLAGLLEDPAERAWVETHLRPLVGLSSEGHGEEREVEAFAAWIRFVEALADEHPLVLVVEDLHWADEKLLDFLDQLVERLTDAAVLVVATARPELLQRRAAWGGGKADAATLSLRPLDQEEMVALLDALLDGVALPPEVQAAVLARADGNPLFAEQYARMLAEHGGGELPLPQSVQGIIAARLDGLPHAEKELLHDAAVHGKVFWAGALEAMSGAAAGALDEPLRALERKEFVRRQRRSSVAGETELAFRHALLREVAYGQIPRAQRADKHRLAAEWLESLAHDRDDLVELLADHYSRALELARAAGRETADLEARARAALRDAGMRAATLNAFAAALRYLDQALALWPAEDEERPHLLALRARALHFLGAEGATEALAEARDELLSAGSDEAAADLDPHLAEMLWKRGDRDRALAQLEDARRLLGEAGLSRAQARILSRLARFRGLRGEVEEAIEVGEDARSRAEALADSELEGDALQSIGLAKASVGDSEGALQDFERAAELLLAANSPGAAAAYSSLAANLWSRGELEPARAAVDKAERLARRFGDAQMLRFLRIPEANWHYAHGDWDKALGLAGEFIAECESGYRVGFGLDQVSSLRSYSAGRTPPGWEAMMRDVRALIRASRADYDGASDDADRAVELARAAENPSLERDNLATALAATFLGGRSREARRYARELLELEKSRITEHHHVLHWLAVTARELGLDDEVGELVGRGTEAPWADAARAIVSGDFLRAADYHAQFHLGPDEAHVRLLAAKALLGEGRREEADQQLERALSFFRKAGATHFIEEAESLLHADA